MQGNVESLIRNNRECKGILIGPSEAPYHLNEMLSAAVVGLSEPRDG
jgi:hypothetical protein